jgi:hypothetical protein
VPDYPLVAQMGVERSEFSTADEQSVPQSFSVSTEGHLALLGIGIRIW